MYTTERAYNSGSKSTNIICKIRKLILQNMLHQDTPLCRFRRCHGASFR